MKAAVLHEYDESLTKPGWLSYEDVPDPVIASPTDVIVRIGGAGVCRTDLRIIEGHWRDRVNINFPHILGHENAGWVEEAGNEVKSVEVGDPVIIHPRTSDTSCPVCGRGNGLGEYSLSPGISANGGYAEYMKTNELALLKLPSGLPPMDAAPYADAGLTAYHTTKKATRHLLPGQYAVIIGAGGLGHACIQILNALCASEIIAVDKSDRALALAREVGAHHTIKADDDLPEHVLGLTKGQGAEVVMDFVGEDDTILRGLAMTKRAGTYYLVGYGGNLEISSFDLIISEKTIVGNLIGSYAELVELIALADGGSVRLKTQEYPLSSADEALRNLYHGNIQGRAVLIP